MEICADCIKELRIAYQFRAVILKSQETLKQYTVRSDTCNDSLPQPKPSVLALRDIKLEDDKETVVDSSFDMEELLIENKDAKDETKECYDAPGYLLFDIKADEVKEFETTFQSGETIQNPRKKRKRDETQQEFKCQPCELTFNKRWKLQKHNIHVHCEAKKFECTYCGRSFKQSFHLREHLASHTGEKSYACTYCDKSFQRLSSHRRHIRSHEAPPGQKTKRTPFLCTICGKSFPFSNGVQRHMRIHLGIKKHECSVCKRKFMQSTHLHVHMRTHTGEKPYVCESCGEAFSLNASLQKHMNIHTRGIKTDVKFGDEYVIQADDVKIDGFEVTL